MVESRVAKESQKIVNCLSLQHNRRWETTKHLLLETSVPLPSPHYQPVHPQFATRSANSWCWWCRSHGEGRCRSHPNGSPSRQGAPSWRSWPFPNHPQSATGPAPVREVRGQAEHGTSCKGSCSSSIHVPLPGVVGGRRRGIHMPSSYPC